jgi:hypothetical protein
MQKRPWGVLGALVLTAGISNPVLAVTATSFSSFEGEEEPTDRVSSSGSVTKGDTYDNMTSPASGTFKFYLRFSSSVWDGDRDTGSKDRQRAEVKGLGSRQGPSDTFDYDHTWKTNRGGSGSFWHVFQLKGVDGDNAAPLVVNSIQSGTSAALRYCSGTQSGFTVARSYTFSLNTFMRSTIRIKPSTGSSGILQLGINGGSLGGKTNIALYRPSSTQYRPKWGSYRGVSSSSPYGNDTVEQKSVMATKR